MLRILNLTAGCLLLFALAACDREKYDTPRNSTSTSRRVTQTAAQDPANDPATRRREQFAAADKDPEFRRLRERFEAAMIKPDNNQDRETTFWRITRAENEFAEYYALHYPDLGIEWLISQPAAPFGAFIAALYRTDSEKAFLLLQSLPKGVARDTYTTALCRLARGENIERGWQLIANSPGGFQNPYGLKAMLVGAQARSDPKAAWETWQTRMEDSANPGSFLNCILPLDAATAFPAQLIDRVPDEKDRIDIVMDAMQVCHTTENAAPLIAWLATQPMTPAYDTIYSEVATWQAIYGDPADSGRWIEKISDPDRRENTHKHVSSIDDAFREKQRKNEQEHLSNPN